MKKLNLLLLVFVIILLSGCGSIPNAPVGLNEFKTSGVNPDSWTLVPAGEFLKGQYKHEGMVENDFEIMVTEVTNSQYAKYLEEALAAGKIKIDKDNNITGFYSGDKYNGGKHEERIDAGDYLHIPLNDPASKITYNGTEFKVKEGYENHPVTMVSWFGAKAFADFYDYRLPTEDEWEKAARGTDGRAYPWGDEISHYVANYYHSGDPFETEEGYSDTTPVGFYNGSKYGDFQTNDSASPYGVYDMAGNVGEWTGDLHHQVHYRNIRGGDKGKYEIDLRLWKINNATPVHVSPSVGFRCVRDPN